MKRKRKVILITCSIVLVAVFVAVAWLKSNGDFYALDRSGMMLSVGETARHLFSNDVENGLMLVSAEFPKQPHNVPVSEAKALQLLKRSSPTWEPIFWTHIDGLGPFGIYSESELGEVALYWKDEDFLFEILVGDGNDLKIRYFADGVPFLRNQFVMLPDGFDFGNWEFSHRQTLENLYNFTRCRSLDPGTPIKELAFYGEPAFQERGESDNGILIYFDRSTETWSVRDWNPTERPLDNWRAYVAEDAEN